MLSKTLEFILTEFLHNGHLQSLGASGIAYFSYVLIFHQNISFWAFLLIYFIFQFIYFNDRFRGIKSDSKTNSVRSSHLSKYAKHASSLMVMYAFLTVFFSIVFSSIYTLTFSIIVMLLGYLYPIYFKLLTKKIYLFKNIYVSSVFSVLTFFPFIEKWVSIKEPYIYFLAIYVFVETFIMQIVLDFKDVISDSKEKLQTLPVLIGEKGALKVLITISLVLYIAVLISTKYLTLDMVFVRLFIFSVLLDILTFYMLQMSNKTAYLLSASKYFLWLLLLLVI